jgi:flavin reductase
MDKVLRPGETSGNFISAMARAATGVSVVTTGGIGGRFGLTVSAMCSVSAEPPLLLACVNRKSPTVAAIDINGIFAVNVLAADHLTYAQTFSGRPESGRPFDFDTHEWMEGITGLPVIPDAVAVFECEIETAYDAGSHRIFIGRVLAARQGTAEPLIYCNRAFKRITSY